MFSTITVFYSNRSFSTVNAISFDGQVKVADTAEKRALASDFTRTIPKRGYVPTRKGNQVVWQLPVQVAEDVDVAPREVAAVVGLSDPDAGRGGVSAGRGVVEVAAGEGRARAGDLPVLVELVDDGPAVQAEVQVLSEAEGGLLSPFGLVVDVDLSLPAGVSGETPGDGGEAAVVTVTQEFDLILGWLLPSPITITRTAQMVVP